jgi:multicomponent Na+:H+ antiporter subunit D
MMIFSDLVMHPAALFLGAAVALACVRSLSVQRVLLLGTPLSALIAAATLPERFGHMRYLGFDLLMGRADPLSTLFLLSFISMAALGALYGLQERSRIRHAAAFAYAAGCTGVVLAGDLLSLFIFWELMAFASVFLIWGGSARSTAAGFRYVLMHAAGGLMLLAGIVLHVYSGGSLAFDQLGAGGLSAADGLMLTGFLLNAAVPPLHAWLADAYPEASPCGVIFLCAFTTKAAVYVLARGFAGLDILAPLGAAAALIGVAYAVIENDARRILAYHIISQVGYMVCAIGIGSSLAVNGACAHALSNILNKGLLFMGVGAVVLQTGRGRLYELGGLVRAMPRTLILTMIGALAISGLPLISGFVSKSIVITALEQAHRPGLVLMLMLASIGTFFSVGIKLPLFIWFGSGKTEVCTDQSIKDPPWNMLLAMTLTAALSLAVGIFPELLQALLPHQDVCRIYTPAHVSHTLQLLAATALGFYVLRRFLEPKPGMLLDVDWLYRRGAALIMRLCAGPLNRINDRINELYQRAGVGPVQKASGVLTRFDRNAIDGFVDGLAMSALVLGESLRLIQTGKIQHYIGGAVIFFFLLMIIVMLQ